MKHIFILIASISVIATSCKSDDKTATSEAEENEMTTEEPTEVLTKEVKMDFPEVITIEGVAQNPEGIAYNKSDSTFFLSSLNAGPIIKVKLDGTYSAFTSGDKFPLSTAGIEIDDERNRLLVAGFNGTELFDEDPSTKGASFLRIYNLETGVIEKDLNLSSLVPDANAYFANDIALDAAGNVYISDWYARVIYKVGLAGNISVFWTNETGVPSGPNGLDFHSDGYLLVSILNVNEQWLYADYGLVKIPVNDPSSANLVDISGTEYTGFDGMVLKTDGNIVGVTNNGISPGGNMLLELSSSDNWETAEIKNVKEITSSTTVAVTPENENYVINQDFTKDLAETWKIEQIKF